MNDMNSNDDFDKLNPLTPLTANSLMRTLCKPDYPPHIVRLLNQVKNWFTKNWRIDGVDMPYWEALREDPEMLYSEISWIENQVALLPSISTPPPRAEAVVLYPGQADLTEAMRLAVDYSLIFSQNECRRVWIISDCWILFDIFEYCDYIRAMIERGISIRFLVVSPWGFVEMPISALSDMKLPGSSSSEGGAGRRKRRDDD